MAQQQVQYAQLVTNVTLETLDALKSSSSSQFYANAVIITATGCTIAYFACQRYDKVSEREFELAKLRIQLEIEQLKAPQAIQNSSTRPSHAHVLGTGAKLGDVPDRRTYTPASQDKSSIQVEHQDNARTENAGPNLRKRPVTDVPQYMIQGTAGNAAREVEGRAKRATRYKGDYNDPSEG